jgi:hypothetical protein
MFGCPLEDAFTTPIHLQHRVNSIQNTVDDIWEKEVQALNEYETQHRVAPKVPTRYRGYLADGSFHEKMESEPNAPAQVPEPKAPVRQVRPFVKEGFEAQYVQWFDYGALFVMGCLLIFILEHILNMGIHFQRML